jgi:hypothetical protein
MLVTKASFHVVDVFSWGLCFRELREVVVLGRLRCIQLGVCFCELREAAVVLLAFIFVS